MSHIVILGAGELAGALARHLAAADLASRIVLVDDAGSVAAGKALDIQQAAPIDGYSSRVSGTADLDAVVGARAILVADRATAPGAEWTEADGLPLLKRVAGLNLEAPIVCAGARQAVLVERGVGEAGLKRTRLFGSAPEGLRSAVVAMTALEAGCTPSDVSLTVVGRPPSQAIVPWEDAAIGGRRATTVLTPPAIGRLDARLPRLWPPGPLTLAAAATRTLRAALTRSPRDVLAFVVLAREEGDAGRAGALPVLLGPAGIARILPLALSTRDRVRLETALS